MDDFEGALLEGLARVEDGVPGADCDGFGAGEEGFDCEGWEGGGCGAAVDGRVEGEGDG